MPARQIHHEHLEKVHDELLFYFPIEGLREYWERHDSETGHVIFDSITDYFYFNDFSLDDDQ